eukprot:332135_1
MKVSTFNLLLLIIFIICTTASRAGQLGSNDGNSVSHHNSDSLDSRGSKGIGSKGAKGAKGSKDYHHSKGSKGSKGSKRHHHHDSDSRLPMTTDTGIDTSHHHHHHTDTTAVNVANMDGDGNSVLHNDGSKQEFDHKTNSGDVNNIYIAVFGVIGFLSIGAIIIGLWCYRNKKDGHIELENSYESDEEEGLDIGTGDIEGCNDTNTNEEIR